MLLWRTNWNWNVKGQVIWVKVTQSLHVSPYNFLSWSHAQTHTWITEKVVKGKQVFLSAPCVLHYSYGPAASMTSSLGRRLLVPVDRKFWGEKWRREIWDWSQQVACIFQAGGSAWSAACFHVWFLVSREKHQKRAGIYSLIRGRVKYKKTPHTKKKSARTLLPSYYSATFMPSFFTQSFKKTTQWAPLLGNGMKSNTYVHLLHRWI